MKKTIYTGKAKNDLVKALYEKRQSLSAFRFGEAGSKTRNVKAGNATRKEIARILTELNRQ
ncbi:MAG: 50S ribosomal protein L29 [Candidatus Zambryskibacteria bacterium]|nr:50S ribosomal protein L29 [Candidatus Zambryskibacteria bacterium]